MKTQLISASAGIMILRLASSCSKAPETAQAKPDSPGARDTYPLTTCVVSGEELGSMGDPFTHNHEGTTVKFCCKNCLPKFNADPGPYLAKLN